MIYLGVGRFRSMIYCNSFANCCRVVRKIIFSSKFCRPCCRSLLASQDGNHGIGWSRCFPEDERKTNWQPGYLLNKNVGFGGFLQSSLQPNLLPTISSFCPITFCRRTWKTWTWTPCSCWSVRNCFRWHPLFACLDLTGASKLSKQGAFGYWSVYSKI